MPHTPRRPPFTLALVLFFAALGGLALGCDDDDGGGPVGPVDDLTGRADLTRYVAIGNSLTAGFQSGALFASGQQCSVPALLARQAGIEDFEMPLISEPGISSTPGAGKLELVSLQPLVIQRAASAGQPTNIGLPRPFNNLGVPGALAFEALTAESAETSLTGNGFFDLVLRDRGTWLEQVDALGATFATVWLGNNEVLGFAISGGTAAGLPIPVSSFGLVYQQFVRALLRTTEQVVLFNIPDVTAIPFLTTIPPVVVNPATGQPVIGPDGQPVPLIGSEGGAAGPLAAGDLVTLNALPLLSQGIGVPAALGGTGQPLPSAVVLSEAEQAVARAAVQGYNQVIAGVAAENGLAVIDILALLEEVATTGIQTDGGLLTDEFLTGGTFSLDGVHPTCKGYGVVANRLIAAINARFGASIPPVSIAALPGIPTPGGALAPAWAFSAIFRGFDRVPLPF
ncbi:MAG: hypothetical protein KY397_03810 [Gemmatimonadetes bacterium]|nr:hypothetical protein [Gemmatimonadota bacterium]